MAQIINETLRNKIIELWQYPLYTEVLIADELGLYFQQVKNVVWEYEEAKKAKAGA